MCKFFVLLHVWHLGRNRQNQREHDRFQAEKYIMHLCCSIVVTQWIYSKTCSSCAGDKNNQIFCRYMFLHIINISTYIVTIYIHIRYAFYIYFPLLFMYINLYVQHLYVQWGNGGGVRGGGVKGHWTWSTWNKDQGDNDTNLKAVYSSIHPFIHPSASASRCTLACSNSLFMK